MLILSQVALLNGQEQKEEKKFGISFSGFVKNDFFYDTRQTVAAREGHFLLWPSPELKDSLGVDINDQANLNMLALQTRLSGKITGPDAFGAKTSGVIEGDFFAQANDNINLFRLRHAFLKLNWKTTELLAGQYWNPLFVTGCFPGTVSFNTGTPLQSFGRNPQIRVSQSLGGLKIIGAVLAQRDFASRGAAGPSSIYLRNAGIPDLHLQLQYAVKNEEINFSYLVGAGIAYKTIVPRISNTVVVSPETTEVELNLADTTASIATTKEVSSDYSVDEKVSGLTVILYQNISFKPLTIKMQYRYGENIADVLAISGIAIKEVTNTAIGEQSYTPFTSHTVWGDIHTNGKTWQFGLFGGMLLNTGTKDPVTEVDIKNNVYGLAANISSLIRISPRIILNSGKVRFAFELEHTIANYGSDYTDKYVPETTTTVSNTRALLSAYYFF